MSGETPELPVAGELALAALEARVRALEVGWAEREAALHAALEARVAALVQAATPRVGIGLDAHRLVAGRPLVLGGVSIEHERGLLGHSDADAVAHAAIEAVLGAAAAGNIGQLFPDRDPAFKDADSLELLRVARQRVEALGYRVQGLDVTILAEKPRLMPHAAAMRANLARVLGVDTDQVSFKATTCEGMGAVGRGEGMAALAVAVLLPLPVSDPALPAPRSNLAPTP